MAAIKDTAAIARKWATVTPARAPDYEEGVRNPRKDWAQATTGAKENYKTGVAAALAEGRFEKGVAKTGTAGWQEGAIQKGVPRWGPGVSMAEGKYAAGFAPFREAIARMTLPPRYAKRDPRNLLRVTAVVNAMIGAAGGSAPR